MKEICSHEVELRFGSMIGTTFKCRKCGADGIRRRWYAVSIWFVICILWLALMALLYVFSSFTSVWDFPINIVCLAAAAFIGMWLDYSLLLYAQRKGTLEKYIRFK